MSQLWKATLLAALWSAPVFSQTITGTITGTVTDSSGSVITSAKVTATNAATNVSTMTEVSGAGVYNLRFLNPGQYTVNVDAAGFKRAILGPITVNVNQIVRLDAQLEIGNLTESIQVTALAPALQTESAQTGAAITSKQATELPLNGRTFAQLALLVPGAVTPDPASFNEPGRTMKGARPYVNGNREQTNNFLLDGIDMNAPIDNTIVYNPSVDALEEVQVLTGNASAEFGNVNGAVVNMAMKSGTNQFHGNVFEFLQDYNLNANGFFANRAGVPKSDYSQNIYGGTFGGPLRRDKLFFFVDYQGTRQTSTGTGSATVVPPALRTGDLSIYRTAFTDPTTGTPFPGNVIPQSRIVNPAAKALFSNPSYYPLPNNPGTGPNGYNANYVAPTESALNNNQGDVKIDYRPTPKDSAFTRFSIARFDNGDSKVVLPTRIPQPVVAGSAIGVLSWTRTLSPVSVNEFRIGYTRLTNNTTTSDVAGVFGRDGNGKLGIPGGQPIAGISAVSFGDFNIGTNANDSAEADNDYHISENYTKQMGRHSLKAGVNLIRYQMNRRFAGSAGLLGTFNYSGIYTGNAYADFLLDQLQGKTRGSLTGMWGQRQWRNGIFVQDDFKVRPNLTLNLGLRWEYTQPLYEVADRQINLDLSTGKPLYAGKDGNSRALYKTYWKQFMPRLGIAWTPWPRLAVRAGYGITSFMEGTGANLRLTQNPPFYFSSSIAYDLKAPGTITTGWVDVVPQTAVSGALNYWNPDLRATFTQQYNLSVEYQFTNNFSLNAAYVGQKSTHVVNAVEQNQPLPGVGPFSSWAPLNNRRPLYRVAPLINNVAGTESSAIMNYNALQVTARRRLSAGLQFMAAYTFSKSLTDSSGYYSGNTNTANQGAYAPNAYNRAANYGPSFFNARHVLSLHGLYQLPIGRGRALGANMSRGADLLAGGWKVNFISSLHTGFPLTLFGRDSTNQRVRGNNFPNHYRPLQIVNQSIDHWFGTGPGFCSGVGVDDGVCAYGNAAQGVFGNSGVGTETAPGYKNLDLSIGKEFHLTEAKYFDFRADAFNIFNHPNFGPPDRNITSTAFGAINGIVGTPRTMQFALKFYF